MNALNSVRYLAVLVSLASLMACGKPPAAGQKEKPVPPARVENGGIKETDLASIKLTPKAEERLGIQTSIVGRGLFAPSDKRVGEVTIPPGQTLVISAPVAGTVDAIDAAMLSPGANVKKGQSLFRLSPLLSAQRDMKVTADAELESARTRQETAKARLARAQQMLKDRVGSVRAVEDARQEQELADTALKTAQSRLNRLNSAPLDADVVLTLSSPLTGMIRQIHAATGQQVAAGAALVEIVRIDPVWIRVPIYAGKLSSYISGSNARVSSLGNDRSGGRIAKPVAAPPTADPLSATADFYFELQNADLSLKPGQKVDVTMPQKGTQNVLQVPASSILYDMNGGTWIYENTAPHTFVRRRVDVSEMQGATAWLRAGVAQGARVVIVGGAELFGTEFGVGK
jgi:membrane fusion protein, heavy metal efflux system